MRSSQSGNVIFIILIAVALLAALAFAVSQGGRGSVAKLSEDQARLAATEIVEYGNIIASAVAQTRLRGYSDTQISFENGVVGGYTNANCGDEICQIFHPSGGGVSYMAPQAEWLDGVNTAAVRYGELYFHAAAHAVHMGTSDDDLILFIPYLNQQVCIAINTLLGIVPTTDAVPSETNGPSAVNIKFTGSYGPAVDRKVSGDGTTGETTILNGKAAGCTEASGTASTAAAGTYHYYKVLIAR